MHWTTQWLKNLTRGQTAMTKTNNYLNASKILKLVKTADSYQSNHQFQWFWPVLTGSRIFIRTIVVQPSFSCIGATPIHDIEMECLIVSLPMSINQCTITFLQTASIFMLATIIRGGILHEPLPLQGWVVLTLSLHAQQWLSIVGHFGQPQ